MTAIGGLAGRLTAFPGERIEKLNLAPPHGWWRRSEAGVLLRRLPAAALAGLGPGGIDIRSGHLLRDAEKQRDVLPAGPMAPGVARFYDSRITRSGNFGPGWRALWEICLQARGDTLAYHDEWGRVLVLPRPQPGHQVILVAESLTLACLEDGSFIVADLQPAYRHFGPFDETGTASLAEIEYLDGSRTTVRRNQAGKLLALVSRTEAGVWFSLDAQDRIQAVARGPQSSPSATFVYGADGRLARVEQGRGKVVRRYGYQDGKLSEITDRHGTSSIRWRGAGSASQIAGLRSPDGQMWLLHRDESAGAVRLEGSDGSELRWRFDTNGRVTEYQDTTGAVYGVEYSALGRPAGVETPLGRYAFEYDDFGRIAQETGPGGTLRRVSYAYATRRPMMLVRESGRHWFWLRDACLRPVQRRAPDGDVTDYAHDPATAPQMRSQTPAGEIRHTYDALGRLSLREMPDGGIARYAWTATGQLRASGGTGMPLEMREQDEAGGLRITRGSGSRMRLAAYNDQGDLLSLANAANHKRYWHYDALGRLEMLIDEEGVMTRYSRERQAQDVTVQGPGGGIQRWVRDAGGRALARQDADGVVTEHRFDRNGRVTDIVEAAGDSRVTTVLSYDGAGRLAERKRAGILWSYEHDAQGRLTSLCADGAAESLAPGALAFAYGEAGLVDAETSAQGTWIVTRDDTGFPIRFHLPCGLVLMMARDASQSLTHLGYSYGGESVVLVSLRHDASGRETQRVGAGLQRVINRDEDHGLRIEHVTRLSDPGTAIESLARRERWDVAGRLVEEEDAQGHRLHDYDRRGQLVRSIGGAGMLYTTWDSGGNIIALDSAGWAPPRSTPDHRIAQVGNIQLSYDKWGRVVRRDGPLVKAQYTWDAAGRLAVAQTNGVRVSYLYDAAGRLAGRRVGTEEEGFPHTFLWEGLRLLQETTPFRRVTYIYGPALPGWQSFAPVACLIQKRANVQSDWSAPEPQHLFTNAAGRVRAVVSEDGQKIWQVPARPWGERQGIAAEESSALPGFAGQWMDPDTRLCWNGLRFYDPFTGRYLSPNRDAPPGVSPYRYVMAPASQANPLGQAVMGEGVAARAGVNIRMLPPVEWAGAERPAPCLPGV
ncbi:RHS repeat-associated core domain-containing protein [Achromobacter seleniivolatilans]|uniref:RHS repeat-associated core domain-containing protein n=1 Tax=Achromobacter seleniivolatilans TaxID=3047478 RepID=A0ABY9M0W0_9BURK|nr:RHS repeat-associated core domain-containing protein [Achromobacter sp. R39]WMD20253.1 RHS repeat-associated core domain-containing protein [Achromobacter sp. R39]